MERTDYVRVGASQTGIFNASDRQSLFKDTKKFVRLARQNCVDVENDTLRSHLKDYFDEFAVAFPEAKLSAAVKENWTEGIEVLMHSYGKAANKGMFAEGFIKTGQHIKPGEDGITVSFQKTMSQCYSKISTNGMKIMEDKTERLSEFILERGTLSWEEMNDAGIPSSETSINRENLTHIRHWSEIVTHAEMKRRYTQEMFDHGPAAQELKKNLAAEEKRIQKELSEATKILEVERKRLEKANAKAEADQLEKNRIAALSPEAREAEKLEKKMLLFKRRMTKSQPRKENWNQRRIF